MSKPAVDRASTRRVLADIDAVMRAQTAAAVDRVLETASPGCSELWGAWENVTVPLLSESGAEPVPWRHDKCLHCCEFDADAVGLPGLDYYLDAANIPGSERRRYAPHVVSPHLFEEADRA